MKRTVQTHQYSRSSGYSLVEVLIGLWLISTLFLLALGIFVGNFQTANYSQSIFKGNHIAYNALQNLKSMKFDELIVFIAKPKAPYTIKTETENYLVTENISRKSNDITEDDYDILILDVRVEWRVVNDNSAESALKFTETPEETAKKPTHNSVHMRCAISPLGQY